jgi:hypothetical protein
MRKKKMPELSITEITSRIRGFVLDAQVPNPHEISVILGCTNISEELQEREEEESEKRLERIAYTVPLLYAFSRLMAEGTVESQKTSTTENLTDVPPEIWREGRRLMESSSFSTLIGAIAQLVDMGLLEIPRKYK